jgi:FtsZ-interacting cell division protein ZipA
MKPAPSSSHRAFHYGIVVGTAIVAILVAGFWLKYEHTKPVQKQVTQDRVFYITAPKTR